MATISTPHLRIRLNLATNSPDSADITVTGSVNLTLSEVDSINRLGNTFKISATLLGDDVGAADDTLVSVGSKDITAPAASSVAFEITRTSVALGELDEDTSLGRADDVFALVSVKNNDTGATAKANTPTIAHQFKVFS